MSKEMVIDGTTYVPQGSEKVQAKKLKGLEYKIVRTYSAGVFAGYIESQEGQEVVMLQARRLWSWEGAASLSQLAEEGVKTPDECKFPTEVAKIRLLQAVEILDVTEEARLNIKEVPVWKM